jgi:hypothetical protein
VVSADTVRVLAIVPTHRWWFALSVLDPRRRESLQSPRDRVGDHVARVYQLERDDEGKIVGRAAVRPVASSG